MSGLFSCKSKGSLSWKGLVDLLSTLHSESFFRITKDGINFNLVDGALAQVIEADWKRENFEEYICDSDEKVGMDLQMLDKVMKRAKKEDDITFSLKDNSVNFMISSGKSYSLQVVANPQDIKERPPVKSSVVVEFDIPLAKLKEIVDDVIIVNDFISVICQKNLAIFSANNKVNKCSSTMTIPDTDQEINSSYSLMFLTSVISAFGNTVKDVKLGFIPNGPLRLRCNVEPLGEIRYYLAPKITDEEHE